VVYEIVGDGTGAVNGSYVDNFGISQSVSGSCGFASCVFTTVCTNGVPPSMSTGSAISVGVC
jgi:hypothetical protein